MPVILRHRVRDLGRLPDLCSSIWDASPVGQQNIFVSAAKGGSLPFKKRVQAGLGALQSEAGVPFKRDSEC